MDGDVTLKLSEASRRCGIDTSTLVMLIEDDVLGGAVRSSRGHTYLREGAVPTYQEAVSLLETGLRQHLTHAQRLMARIQVEMEAVSNDVAAALDNLSAPLGMDLAAFDASSTDERAPLAVAMSRLQSVSWAIAQYNQALRGARTVRG